MNPYQRRIQVECKDCKIIYSKRADSLPMWKGYCVVCARKRTQITATMRAKLIEGQRQSIADGTYAHTRRPKRDSTGHLNPNWKGGKPYCATCQKQLGSYRAKLCRSCARKGIPRPPEIARKVGASVPRGPQHYMWKGGKSLEDRCNTPEYRVWRKAVFTRDNFTCMLCGDRSREGHPVTLNADHIKPYSEYPELGLDVANGRTLCKGCHKKTDTFGWKQSNKTRKQK